jgi:hypothetical protein
MAVVGIVIVGYQMARQKRTRQLREQYGAEYDRAVDLADSRHEAESELLGPLQAARTAGGAQSRFI